MQKIISFLIFFLVTIVFSQATIGPEYIKQELTNSGVYTSPNFEFTTEYDSYNTISVNGTIRGLFFEGLPYTNAVNGNNETKVFAWYGEPAGLTVNEKVPAVILVHGGGGRAFTEWVAEWVNRGYIAIAMSNRGTTPNDESFEYAGPSQPVFFSDNDGPLQDQWFYHAIANSMLSNSLLRNDSFTTHVDKDNIGITGISWGGIINTVIAGIDDRLDFVVPVYGCGFLTKSPIYSTQFASMSNTAQDFYLANWEPSLYTPLHAAPMLFIDGNKDLQFTLNIFGETYEASNSPEKFLRIENLMGHGHVAGRAPEEIYDFADYVTGFNTNAVKPLEYTSETIDTNRNINYTYNFEGAVDEALLFYTKDTIQWGKEDDKYVWLTKTANLNNLANSGIITTTLPDEAQAYYINVNNTTDGSMYSSVIKYAIRDYDWYNYGTGVFNTLINNTSGATLTDGTTNPNTSGINTSTNVGKFEKTSGDDAKIVFNLNENITDLSIFKQKIKIYLDVSDLSSIPNKNIKIYLSNATIDYKVSSVSKNTTINTGQSWVDYTFDFTDETIPLDIVSQGGFNQVILAFAPDDTTTNGTVYYFDDLRGTIEQPEYIAPEPYYDWLNYTENTIIEEINYINGVGGDYTKLYDVSLDTDITSSGSTSGIATKFTKTTANPWHFAQMRYNFEEGSIQDAETITFRLRALFKPETIDEINILNDDSRSISIYLQDLTGDTNTNQIFATAYFTETNKWETLEFTYNSTNLIDYDRVTIITVSGKTYPIDENGVELTDEDLVYYIESLTANVNIGDALSVDSIEAATNTVQLFPNPVKNELMLSEKVTQAELFTMLGQHINSYKNTNQINMSSYQPGMYFLSIQTENGNHETVRFIKN
ncbi:T9SS type A sorting domain-containing protein [Algibacter sp. L3A6]|uniref:T9SS type A sorting domain-containing protein n=1 Tax=Algibacter sp. L3A6 TaxID=2686366 RepID=UPI00131AD6A5|nr:T9SS type A sorting domain-containing protein [Algibacter sp. L3A6]